MVPQPAFVRQGSRGSFASSLPPLAWLPTNRLGKSPTGSKTCKSGQKRSKTPLHHRPPHAWPTLADTVLAWPPPQPRTSASANRDIQARGKITLPPQISLPTFPKPDIKFDFLLKVRVLDDSAAGRIEAIHPTRPLVHHEASEPDDGAEDPGKIGSSALLWRL